MKYFSFALSITTTILLTLFLNGNVWNGITLPPLGKMLNPFTGIWQNGQKTSRTDINLHSVSIKQDIEIVLDEREVPHIYANSLNDALFAQGYMHAKHRYFQMDMMSRSASGRVAEVAGPSKLSYDLSQRRKGMVYAIEQAERGWKKFPDRYQLIQKYVDGVNTALAEWSPANYPLEYKLLNVPPEPWTIKKTIMIVKMMANDLAGRGSDIPATNMLEVLGNDLFFSIYDEHEDIENPVILDEYLSKAASMRKDTIWAAINKDIYYKTDFKEPIKGIGSNNWAISGSKTESGNPIFANDPHLTLSLPSIWYETHLQYEDVNAYGVTIPGMPGLIMGWNDQIAWGETNVSQDIKDYYEIEWTDVTKSHYMFDGKPTPTKIVVETYKVKGTVNYKDTLRYTIHGPVVYESPNGDKDLAVRWLAHDEPESPEMMTFIDAMSAKSYDEYLKATEVFITPAQNFLAASKFGDIGLRVNGKFYKKSSQDGRFVKKGNNSEYLSMDYIPIDENPQMRNPDRGWIASSNQVSTSDKYPYYFNGRFEHYRNRTIDSLLNHMSNITATEMMDMQQNSHGDKARDLLPRILDNDNFNEENEDAVDIHLDLSQWNHNYHPELKAPSYFEEWYTNIYRNTWDEIYAFSDSMQILYPTSWKTIEFILEQPNHKFFDIQSTPKKETASDIIRMSFLQMQDTMQERIAEGKSNNWNDYSPMHIWHLLRVPALSRKNVLHTGSGDAINSNINNFGPSWRMVVDLKDKPLGYGVYPGGQSGNPLSNEYDSNIEMWEQGKYHEIDIYLTKEEWKINGQTIQINAQQ